MKRACAVTLSPIDTASFIALAVSLACESVRTGNGGPFGAVVVRDGMVVGSGANRVTESLDPTAHAEIVAIRAACQQTGSFTLTGASIFASCEPCPMCLAAIHWARISHVYYAATAEDAARAGFDDRWIAEQIGLPPSDARITRRHLLIEGATAPFELWADSPRRVPY